MIILLTITVVEHQWNKLVSLSLLMKLLKICFTMLCNSKYMFIYFCVFLKGTLINSLIRGCFFLVQQTELRAKYICKVSVTAFSERTVHWRNSVDMCFRVCLPQKPQNLWEFIKKHTGIICTYLFYCCSAGKLDQITLQTALVILFSETEYNEI